MNKEKTGERCTAQGERHKQNQRGSGTQAMPHSRGNLGSDRLARPECAGSWSWKKLLQHCI